MRRISPPVNVLIIVGLVKMYTIDKIINPKLMSLFIKD